MMGRGVATAEGALTTVYIELQGDRDIDGWRELLDFIRSAIKCRYRSFWDTERWIGREVMTILENRHAEVTISEYCGIMAVCLRVYDNAEYPELAKTWIASIEKGFRTGLQQAFEGSILVKQGTMSNGVSVFHKE